MVFFYSLLLDLIHLIKEISWSSMYKKSLDRIEDELSKTIAVVGGRNAGYVFAQKGCFEDVF